LEKNTYRVLKIVIQSFYVILKTIFSPENSAQLGGNSCFREIFLCHLFQLGGRLEEKVSFLKLVDLPREKINNFFKILKYSPQNVRKLCSYTSDKRLITRIYRKLKKLTP
jgi:hypothetical protein